MHEIDPEWAQPDNIDELRRHIERLSAFRGSYETETTVDEMFAILRCICVTNRAGGGCHSEIPEPGYRPVGRFREFPSCNWNDGWRTGRPTMEQLSVRLSDRTLYRLDGLAAERGVTRTQVVRQLLEAGLRDRPPPPSDALSEEELLALLTEKARMGNVSAIRLLLAREAQKDPRAQALALFEEMAARRQ